MKAIQVNPETFDKIAKEITPISMNAVKEYYDSLTPDKEAYITVSGLDGTQSGLLIIYPRDAFFSKFILMTTEGDWRMFPNDWFEVKPNGQGTGKEVRCSSTTSSITGQTEKSCEEPGKDCRAGSRIK